jgi:putative CocE/NonD family hydrolase
MKFTLALACVTALLGQPASAVEPPASADAAKVRIEWGVKIPMRDGVRLNATVYMVKAQNRPSPCLFTLTPYISQTYHDRGVYFAANGYPFLTVDVRGRGNSGGDFRPLIQEAQDGYDIVEWLAKQAYCNGKISMWGGSYAGYDQWAAAKEFPPHLATIVPVASPYAGIDFPMRNNIHFPYAIQWLTYVSGHASQEKIFADRPFWAAIDREWLESGRPFRDIDTLAGNPSSLFQEWLLHPIPDAYWDAYNPTSEQYSRLQIPILTITGSYDDDQPGALTHYREYMRNATPEGRARHYLIIGPWDHAGTRTPSTNVGGLHFGPQSLVDLPRLHLEWYAWTMQNGPKPAFLQKPVAYYVMGAEQWRYADTLEGVTAESRPYYLDSMNNATDVLASGSLQSGRPGNGKPDHYVYDPRDISGAEAESLRDPASLTDQHPVFSARGKQLIYHTAAFERDTPISGFFQLTAWIAIDRPDTDLRVSVFEIDADGNSILLTSDQIRARYRESLREAKLIGTTKPLRYEFHGFTFMSRQIKQGSRLRLVIAPINSIYSEKNYNSGRIVAEESVKDARDVTVTLFHDREHPSALRVPIGD